MVPVYNIDINSIIQTSPDRVYHSVHERLLLGYCIELSHRALGVCVNST